jgi:hypothetical protein
MELEKQVCSLGLAKNLKGLGVKQDSLWWWVNHYDNSSRSRIWSLCQKDEDDKVNPHISAFTVAEIGEIFPTYTGTFKLKLELIHRFDGRFQCMYEPRNHSTYADTEANARAKMLIYLLEQELTTNQS